MSAVGFTTTDLANAVAALKSGALRVQLGDRLIIYRSQKEIIQLIAIIQNELNGVNTTDTAQVVQAGFTNGRLPAYPCCICGGCGCYQCS